MGRKVSMQSVRDELHQWFAIIRGSVKTRIPKKALVVMANKFRDEYISANLAAGKKVKAAQIRLDWIDRFITDYRVSRLAMHCNCFAHFPTHTDTYGRRCVASRTA